MRGEARPLTAGFLILAVLGAFVASRLTLRTDITHFLPRGEADREVELARALATGELTRSMVLLVEADDTDSAVEASRAFEAALRAEPRVAPAIASLDSGPAEQIEQALWQLYQPRRFAFLASDADAASALLTPTALAAAAVTLKDRLASPMSGLLGKVAPADPLLILPALLRRVIGRDDEGLRVADGRFVTTDGTAAVLFLTTLAPASDAAAQRPLLAGIRAAFATAAADTETPLSLAVSGAHRFAVRAETAIKADIERVSIGSAVGLLLFFVLLFRSLRLVCMVLPIVGTAFLAGTSACLLVFGSVHGLTLAFGAAMIGVSIDYAVHYYCHHVAAPAPDGARATLRGIQRGLSLSAATTIVGFVALLLSAFPGLREMAVFAICGIAAALLATHLLLPGLAPRPAASTASQWPSRIIGRLQQRRRVLWLVPGAVLVLGLAGLPQMQWDDGIGSLNRIDPALQAEDEAVRERVVRYEQRRLVVAIGDDEQAALAANDQIAAALAAAAEAEELGGSRSIATLLPSAARQRAVDAAVRGRDGLWPDTRDALAAAGFRPEGFAPFQAALEQPPPPPLQFADLAASPLAALARPFRVTLGDATGFVSFLHDVRDEANLRKRLATIDGAWLIDIEAALSRAYGAYRVRMAWLLGAGLFAVLALVAARHRAVRPTLIACAPALLAALGTLGLVSLLGWPLNLLSVVALLMVVSMGVDYGVLLAESRAAPRALAATNLAVFVAGISTILGFGLLAFSHQPALFSIGSTAGIGVLLCLILAPAVSALASPRPTP